MLMVMTSPIAAMATTRNDFEKERRWLTFSA